METPLKTAQYKEQKAFLWAELLLWAKSTS